MRLLLDSHVVLWWLAGRDELGERCREAITEADEAFVSAVTPWELGLKQSLGRLSMPERLVDRLRAEGFLLLDVTAEHAERAASLPPLHRDPFDRMLVAQAQLDGLTLVSADRTLAAYDVVRLDAR